MKKIIFITIVLALTTSQAQYIIKIPFEQGQGGGLPSGSINFKESKPALPPEKWQLVESVYSNWSDKGDVYGCIRNPEAATILKDVQFTQTVSGCKQDQVRTIQKREQETTTLVYRNVDDPVSEIKTNTIATYVTTSLGTSSCSYSYPQTYWLAGINDSHVITLNGVVLPVQYGAGVTSVYYAGKYYYKGTTVQGTTNGRPLYAVCT